MAVAGKPDAMESYLQSGGSFRKISVRHGRIVGFAAIIGGDRPQLVDAVADGDMSLVGGL